MRERLLPSTQHCMPHGSSDPVVLRYSEFSVQLFEFLSGILLNGFNKTSIFGAILPALEKRRPVCVRSLACAETQTKEAAIMAKPNRSLRFNGLLVFMFLFLFLFLLKFKIQITQFEDTISA